VSCSAKRSSSSRWFVKRVVFVCTPHRGSFLAGPQIVRRLKKHASGAGGMTKEHDRLAEARTQNIPWKKWGPYLSERQWGTVRARTIATRAMRGITSATIRRARGHIAGEKMVWPVSDDRQYLCFALALWNGKNQREA
jgi:hypothetical protein